MRPKERYTEAEKAAAEVAAEHGLEITIVQGGSIKTAEQVDGKNVLTKSRALIMGDKMIVRSDDPLFSPAQIARHEAAHRQIENGELSLGTAVRQLRQQYSTAQIREMIRLYTAAYGNTGMNARQVLEEMVCDAMGRMNAFATDETSTVAGEVGQFLRDLRKAAKNETMNSDGGTQTEGQKKNAPEGVKHSREMEGYDYTRSFEQQLEDWKDGKIPKNDTLLVGATPEVFKGIGMPALPVTINGTHIDYALNNSKDFDHFLGADLLKQLPEAIKKPVAIMTSGTKSNSSVVAMLEVRHNGKQVIVPVAVGGFGFQNGIQIDSNAITSAYGKNNSISKVLHDAIEQESNGKFRLYYLDEEKATALFQVARVPMPKMPGTHDGGFIHTLTDTASPVKLKISSVTQSQQFKRWFGDWQNDPAHASKVVNADGTPKVVYHGTNEDFTVFDRSKGKKRIHLNVLGDGNYFTALEQGAARYGSNVVAAYLDIKNPYVKADGFNTVADQIASEFGIARDSFTGKEVSSILRRRGYDGVVMYDGNGEIVIANAFGSNQIKSATDNIGTFDGKNPDIRYSREMELDSEGNALTQEQTDFFADSEVRNDDGELIPVYHKTTESFTVFKRGKLGEGTLGNADDASLAATSLIGHWFSDSENTPFMGGAMKTYLNIKKPYYTSLDEMAADLGDFSGNLEMMQDHFDRGQYNMVREAARSYVRWMKWKGYDGLIVNDTETGGTSYVILNSNQAKLTDNGIPSTKRDIRYSRELETVEALKRQNELLQEQRDYWKEQTRTTDEKTRGADKGEVRSLANQLIRQYSSKTEVDEIMPEMQWLADSIWKNDPKISYTDLQDSAQNIARLVLDGSEVNLNAENWETGQELKRFLRGRYINVDESLKEDIGDFKAFKQSNRSLHFRENGTGWAWAKFRTRGCA